MNCQARKSLFLEVWGKVEKDVIARHQQPKDKPGDAAPLTVSKLKEPKSTILSRLESLIPCVWGCKEAEEIESVASGQISSQRETSAIHSSPKGVQFLEPESPQIPNTQPEEDKPSAENGLFMMFGGGIAAFSGGALLSGSGAGLGGAGVVGVLAAGGGVVLVVGGIALIGWGGYEIYQSFMQSDNVEKIKKMRDLDGFLDKNLFLNARPFHILKSSVNP